MTRAELQALIADGKLDKAVREVTRQAERSGEADWLHRALHLSGRFRELQQREHANLISFEEASRSRAQVAHALLALVQELPEPDATSPKALFQGPLRWLIGAALVVLIAGLIWLQSRTGQAEPFHYTLRLELRQLPHYPPPATESAVLAIWHRNEWKAAVLSPDLVADFKNLDPGLKDEQVAIQWKGRFWKAGQDSIRLAGTSGSLPLLPDGSLSTLRGRVVGPAGAGKPGIVLEAAGQRDTTGEDGGFVLTIPISEQRLEYALRIQKPDGTEQRQMAYPGPTDIEIVLK